MTLNKLTTLTNGQHVGELTTWQTCTGSYPSERFNRTVLLSKKSAQRATEYPVDSQNSTKSMGATIVCCHFIETGGMFIKSPWPAFCGRLSADCSFDLATK